MTVTPDAFIFRMDSSQSARGTGQLLNRVEMGQTPAGEITLPIGNLANGTYLLKIYRNGIADSVKIIVK